MKVVLAPTSINFFYPMHASQWGYVIAVGLADFKS